MIVGQQALIEARVGAAACVRIERDAAREVDLRNRGRIGGRDLRIGEDTAIAAVATAVGEWQRDAILAGERIDGVLVVGRRSPGSSSSGRPICTGGAVSCTCVPGDEPEEPLAQLLIQVVMMVGAGSGCWRASSCGRSPPA